MIGERSICICLFPIGMPSSSHKDLSESLIERFEKLVAESLVRSVLSKSSGKHFETEVIATRKLLTIRE